MSEIIKDEYAVDINTVKEEFKQGVRHWNNGFPYHVSTGIDGEETYGYGILTDNGYWQYPFPSEVANLDIIKAENRLRWKNERSK